MKKLLILFCLLFSVNTMAQGFGNQGDCRTCITIAGKTIDTSATGTTASPTKIIEVVVGNEPVANSYSSGKYYVTATATITDASVPLGKQWVFLAGKNHCTSASAATCRFNLGYDSVTHDSANDATPDDVYCGSHGDASVVYPFGGVATGVGLITEFSCVRTVPQGQFPFIRIEGGGPYNTTLYFREEDN